METIDYGHGVPPLSRIIYGVWRLADDADHSLGHVRRKIELCLDQGITSFDHADIYGDHECEMMFGRALNAHPELKRQMQIITKCDIKAMSADKFPQRRVGHYDTSAAHIRQSVENSLNRIGIEAIDLLLIHRPDPLMDHCETGAVLDALIAEGKIKGAGVSNFMPWDIDLLQSAMRNRLVTNQIEISLLHKTPFTNGQIAKAQMDGAPPMAWSPLGGGALFLPGSDVAKRTLPRLNEIGHAFGVAAEAVALAWLLAHPARIVPVVGTNTASRIARLSDAFKVRFDRETWFELWILSEGAQLP